MTNTTTILTATEAAKAIRKALKAQHGWTSKQVSVRSTSCAVKCSVRTVEIPLRMVEAIANEFSRIRYCEATGDILGGGNLFVSVGYASGTLDTLADGFQGMIVDGFSFGPIHVVDKRSGGWLSVTNSEMGPGRIQLDAYPDASAAHTFARALALSGHLGGYGLEG